MNSQLAIVTDTNSTITIKRSLYKELARDFGADITILNQVGKEFQFNLTYFAEKQTTRLNAIFSILLSQNKVVFFGIFLANLFDEYTEIDIVGMQSDLTNLEILNLIPPVNISTRKGKCLMIHSHCSTGEWDKS